MGHLIIESDSFNAICRAFLSTNGSLKVSIQFEWDEGRLLVDVNEVARNFLSWSISKHQFCKVSLFAGLISSCMIWPLQLSATEFRFYESIESESALIWALVTGHNNIHPLEIPKHRRDTAAPVLLSLSLSLSLSHFFPYVALLVMDTKHYPWWRVRDFDSMQDKPLLVGCNLLPRWAENVTLNLKRKKKKKKRKTLLEL